MKILIQFLVISFLFYALLPSNIIAQSGATLTQEESLQQESEPAEIVDSRELRAEFVESTQNPDSKIITYEMVLTSEILSERVRVEWEITGVSTIENVDEINILRNIEATERRLEGDLTILPGETYRIPIHIKPTRRGVTEVFGTARAVNVDNTIITTVRKNFASNDSGEVLPITDAYRQAQVYSLVLNIVLIVSGLLLLLLIGFFGLRFFIRWYKADEEELYEASKRE